MKDSDKVLWIGAAGVAAFFLYRWWKNNSLGQTYGSIGTIADNTGGAVADVAKTAAVTSETIYRFVDVVSNAAQSKAGQTFIAPIPSAINELYANRAAISTSVKNNIPNFVTPIPMAISKGFDKLNVPTAIRAAVSPIPTAIQKITRKITSKPIPTSQVKASIGLAPKATTKPVVSAASVQQQINKKLNPFKK